MTQIPFSRYENKRFELVKVQTRSNPDLEYINVELLTKGLKFFPLPVELAEQYPYHDKLYRDLFYSK